MEEVREGRAMLAPEGGVLGEERMVQEERWQEIRRMHREDRLAVTEIARRLDLDRKTVRRCLSQERWQRYRRPERTDTLLAEHAEYLTDRAPQVGYSAQVLYQELKGKGYRGSYDTVKRFVRPLRSAESLAERASVRFETPPGQQSQIDWGQTRVHFRHQRTVLHLFVLTLGYSRRGFLETCRDERLAQFLDAHERAFDHFGGHTREHLYDRPRTICRPDGDGGVLWNGTFQSFARYWGFETRLCRPYRARTKGKVESGVKYIKRNFLAGRSFVDELDVREQWAEWNATVADVRIHGTTHQRPLDRFATEREHLLPRGSRPGFRLEARFPRIVASDFLVSLDTNRYSVPFRLIGQAVEVVRAGGEVRIHHRGQLVAQHAELLGRHEVRVLPEHGPGAIARNGRKGSTIAPRRNIPESLEVEVRDLATYELVLAQGGAS
jgi:transposase